MRENTQKNLNPLPDKHSKKIFFVCQGKRSFFETDIAILKEQHQVEVFDRYPPSWKDILTIFQGVRRNGLVYIWFLGRHAVLPLIFAKLLRKKTILVAGGWDVASCPEIDYGLMRPSLIRPFLKWLFRLPNVILSISESNRRDLLKNTGASAEKSKLIYLGVEVPAVSPPFKKERMVMTVGEINQNNLKRKGLEIFVRAAAHFPEIPFVLAGQWSRDGAGESLKKIATSNVQFPGYVSNKELTAYMQKAAVYAQLSYHEAFGRSLAEAMLYECVPVATDRFSLPEIIGNTGYAVPYGDEDAAARAIQQALESPQKGQPARQKILNSFSLEKRREGLDALIKEL